MKRSSDSSIRFHLQARRGRFKEAWSRQKSGMRESEPVAGVIFEIGDTRKDRLHDESDKIVAIVEICPRSNSAGTRQFARRQNIRRLAPEQAEFGKQRHL